ncbi:hypothetical protein [Mesorhizobium ventifaucium]|uniref:Nuclear transport factor 2 family protein n=1 Tax=Mesorhizobium ventifaucium TaxID=666020 RepID=A0ABN8JXV7_9HYPH|nr:hypothetical protein [Mesorhizobium ventifaucium]CAH2402864.1 conserved hypothetical protein [Mesorhizobium ventifaucium]
MDAQARKLFERYERLFRKSLAGDADMDEMTSVYAAAFIRPDVTIDFDVHYLVQKLAGEPKIFGWVSGDEQEVLRKHGIG